jgi:hypothetical protein
MFMKNVLGIAVFFLTISSFASSLTVVEKTKKTAQKFPTDVEVSEVTVALYADPSATSCKVWEAPVGGNDINPGVSCDQVVEVPVGTKLKYTGNYTTFVAVGRKHLVNQAYRGFLSFEVSYETPDNQTGTGFIRAIDRSKLWGNSADMMAAYGFKIQLPEVAKGGF